MRAAVKFHRALRRARANLGDDIDRDARFIEISQTAFEILTG